MATVTETSVEEQPAAAQTTTAPKTLPQLASAAKPSVSKSRPTTKRPTTPRDLFPQPPNPFLRDAPVTLYSFPDYKPVAMTSYPSTHLLLPLRRDLLHRAVIFEGDNTRQGTASTKWRTDVHGSGRKIRPQKGSGRARLGDKKSPVLRGGGVAFGPKPRDFGTDLPKKIYDLAWRTALSYRYRRGELIVIGGEAEIDRKGPGSVRWVREMMTHNQWGRAVGGSLFLTPKRRDNLFEAFEGAIPGEDSLEGWGRALTVDDVDVKDLLGKGRIIVEKSALDRMFAWHTSDLKSDVRVSRSLTSEDVQRLREINALTA